MQLEGPAGSLVPLKIRAVTELAVRLSALYLEGMRNAWGKTVAHGAAIGAMLVALFVLPASAQQTDDAAGREYFEQGRTAFDRADYETALVYFRRAYQLSARSELQYNIGIAAARLQREEEALRAFQSYLEETDQPTRAAEVRERIDALERSLAERRATELALKEATIQYRPLERETERRRAPSRRPRSSGPVRLLRPVRRVSLRCRSASRGTGRASKSSAISASSSVLQRRGLGCTAALARRLSLEAQPGSPLAQSGPRAADKPKSR